MNFQPTSEQKVLQEMIASLLDERAGLRHVRALEEKGADFDTELYKEMGEYGLLALHWPSQWGGSEGSWSDLSILYEEMGARLVAIPHASSVLFSGDLIMTCSTDDVKQSILPALAAGEATITIAWRENAWNGSASFPLRTTAKQTGDQYLITGEKRFVRYMATADHVVVLAELEGSGPTWFLVSTNQPGVTWQVQSTIGGRNVYRLQLNDVAASTCLSQRAGDGFALLRERIRNIWALWAAYGAGAGQAALNMSVQYMNERHQFGRPIGSFQAPQHKMADILVEVQQAQWLSRYAVDLLDRGIDCEREAAMALLRAQKAFEEAAVYGTIFHGGYGFMLEYDIQLFYRLAKEFHVEWTNTEELQTIILEADGFRDRHDFLEGTAAYRDGLDIPLDQTS